MKKPLKIGAYLRVSTDKQVQVFEGSLETQKFRMQEFVKLKNFGDSKWGEIVEFYIEEGYSAGSDRRPQYQRLMSDIRKKKIDLILISDLTRLSRNIEDFCALQRELEKYNAGFFSMKEQFDASTPSGRMMVNLMVSMAQFEREQTAERVAINCHSRAMRGYVNGGKPILGYSRHPERKGVLVINEEEAPIVKMIFDLFLQNGTRAKTISALHEKQIFPKRTVKESTSTNPVKWTPQSLSNVLNQAAYIGYKEVNKTYKNENPESLKPWQKYQMVKASWPAIIEESKFWEAQRILEEASAIERERLQSGERKTFFLSHLLTCGECGRPLVGQSAHGKSGNIHRYYYHSRKFDDHNCQRPRLHAGVLEEKLITDLKAGLSVAGYFDDLEKSIIATQKSQVHISESEVERLKKEFSEVNSEISGIWRLQSGVQLGEDSLKMASERLEDLAKRKKALESQIQEHERIVADKASVKDKVIFVEDNLKDLLRGWAKATNAMKKRLLRRAIKRIVVTKDEMKVVFWLSAEERDGSNTEPKASEIESGADVLEFRRRSRQAFEKSDRNLSIPGSLIGKIGRGART